MTGVALRPDAFRTRAPGAAVAVSAIAIAVLVIGNRALPVGLALGAVAIPLAAWIFVLRQEREGNRVDVRWLVLAIGAVMAIAVALEPSGSSDLWSYTMYGRMVSQHGASPYSHVPNDFPYDPFLHLVARGWRNTPSVYGPVFVAFSAVGTALAGGSVLAARLFQQGGAAIAVAIAAFLVWRRTTSPAAVMLLALNPLVVVSVVNGGHNDALVGLGVLGAVLLTERRRVLAAGIVLALAALIKITALLALPALLAWVLVRSGRKAAGHLAGGALATVAIGYAIVGPTAARALDANHRLMSRASLWQAPRTFVSIDGRAGFAGLSSGDWLGVFGVGSIAVVGALAVAVAWRRRSEPELGGVVALALCAYFVAGIYVLPWYCMWAIPAVCIVRRPRVPLFVASLGAFVTAVYVVRDRALPGTVGPGWWWLTAYIGPLVALLAFLVVGLGRDHSDGEESVLAGARPLAASTARDAEPSIR